VITRCSLPSPGRTRHNAAVPVCMFAYVSVSVCRVCVRLRLCPYASVCACVRACVRVWLRCRRVRRGGGPASTARTKANVLRGCQGMAAQV
jgi:hypothetical protein